ncbi:MAG: cation transporter [Methanobacterium sp.]|uniref:cation diffusion facilitator family transporter n=1 Tax=Methanobacterium sp. TaxID=2164 RepID=UPI003D64F9AE|nr:cation transporter [Methanobacterium sp.]
MNIEERKKLGRRAVLIAIFGNVGLTIFNFVVGILSGSTALIAEAAHTFSDILTSIITFIGFRISLKPPDKLHPYGHGRAEPLVGLVIVVFLGIIAFEILSEVYKKVLLGGPITPPETIAAVMALVGVFVNFVMTTYIMKTGKKINSPAIIADAQHQKVDIFSSAAIFVGVIGAQLGFPILDPIVAIFIAIMVLKTAFDVGRENINNILGTVPSKEILDNIQKSALYINGALGVHNVRINYLGPYASVELHVTVTEDLSLKEAHEIAHNVEKKVIEDVEIVSMVTVHICPDVEDEVYCVDK